MKKSTTAIIGVIVVIVLLAGGYMIFHKSNKATSSNSSAAKGSVAAVNNAVLTTKTDTALGQYLASPSGMALYTYGSDTSGVSNCTGACLTNWPAYQDTGSTTGLPAGISTIKRADNGQVQYVYNGMPLYTFAQDSNGHVTGNGVSNFSVATPAAASTQPATGTTNNSSAGSTDNSASSNPYNY